jgi:hypothetical protein
MTTSISEKIIGEITRVEFSGDFQRLVVTYKYTSESGSLIKQGFIEFNGDEIDTLDSTVQQILPNDYDTYNERDKMMYKYLNGFKIKMAETFNIEVTDIEII